MVWRQATTRWADDDVYGHMNNARYFELIDTAVNVHLAEATGTDIRALTFPADAVLAFGSERHGVSAEVRQAATELVAIPMRPGVSSFNLATSVGMALFHWLSTRST